MDALVSTDWLAERPRSPDLAIVDATMHALDPSRDAAAEFAGGHLPGAVFLGLGTLADPASDLPGMLPPAALLAERMAVLGLGQDRPILLYDRSEHRTAARAWWMLRLFGWTRLAILDGGEAKWRAESRPLETGAPAEDSPALLAICEDRRSLRTLEQMRSIQSDGSAQIADARSAARFAGTEPETRAGVVPGHIPGSRNLPYADLFHPDGTWKRGPALRAAFEAAGIEVERPVVTTCGSGVTAAILAFGLHLLGRDDWALYDGSWAEWGGRPDTPKASGAA